MPNNSQTRARQKRLNLLHKVTNEILTNLLDYESAIKNLTKWAVSSLATWCVVDLVTEEGNIERIAAGHANPAMSEAVEEIRTNYPASPSAQRGVYKAIQSRESILIPKMSEEDWKRRSDNARHFELIMLLGSSSCMCIPLVARGHAIGAIMFLSDTKIYDHEDLWFAEELSRKFAPVLDNIRMFRRMQESIRLRDEFISIAAHELKTPLTSLMLHASIVQKYFDKKDLNQNDLEKMMKLFWISDGEVKRLADIVEKLLDTSKINTNQNELKFSEVNLSLLAKEILTRMEPHFSQSEQRVEFFESTSMFSAIGIWDAFKIEQLITNLISNAVKFGEKKPVLISVSAQKTHIILEVQDKGMGIALEHQSKVFEQFGKRRIHPHISGLGLGLYITHEIIKLHKGEISLKSELGQGSSFMVRLPRMVPL